MLYIIKMHKFNQRLVNMVDKNLNRLYNTYIISAMEAKAYV